MSQYRDEQSAARLRIENLEARVAEQEAEIAWRDALLASRDETIDRLRSGPRRMRGYSDQAGAGARASRALGLSIVTMASSAAIVAHMMHPHVADHALAGASGPGSEPHLWMLAPVAAEDRSGSATDSLERAEPAGPLHADPASLRAVSFSDVRDPFAPVPPPPSTDGPMVIRRQVEPRVWGPPPRRSR